MRLCPLAFLTFQQFPFFSPFRSFIHHPSHLFTHSASLSSFHSFHPHSSALPTLHCRSPHPCHIHHLSVISTISPLFPPSLRHFHHLSVISTISPSFPPSFRHIALSLHRILQFLTIIAQSLFFKLCLSLLS